MSDGRLLLESKDEMKKRDAVALTFSEPTCGSSLRMHIKNYPTKTRSA
jgi:hypothetical protein